MAELVKHCSLAFISFLLLTSSFDNPCPCQCPVGLLGTNNLPTKTKTTTAAAAASPVPRASNTAIDAERRERKRRTDRGIAQKMSRPDRLMSRNGNKKTRSRAHLRPAAHTSVGRPRPELEGRGREGVLDAPEWNANRKSSPPDSWVCHRSPYRCKGKRQRLLPPPSNAAWSPPRAASFWSCLTCRPDRAIGRGPAIRRRTERYPKYSLWERRGQPRSLAAKFSDSSFWSNDGGRARRVIVFFIFIGKRRHTWLCVD